MMVFQPEGVSGVLGGRAILVCTISLDSSLVEDAEIYWSKDWAGTYEDRNTLKIVGKELQRLEHSIPAVNRADQGWYRCHARTSFDEVVSEGALLDIKRSTEVTSHPEDWTVEVGDDVEFHCGATTDPSLTLTMKISWLKDGAPIVTGPDVLIDEGGARLVLRSLKKEDSGILKCVVKTAADSVTSRSGKLVVLLPTRITESSSGGREVVEGSSLTLKCKAETDSSIGDSLTVVWELAGVALREADSRLVRGQPGHLDIRLEGRQEESGNYQCVARTSKDEARSAVAEVMVRRATVVRGPAAESVKMEGDTIWLECAVQVDPDLKEGLSVTWSRDGEVVGQGEALVMDNASLEHSGAYSCEAKTRLDSGRSIPAEVVVYPKSQLVVEPKSQNLLAGLAHNLECRAEVAEGLAARGLVWSWEREDKQVQKEEKGGLSSTLRLEKGGTYRCTLRTVLETVTGQPALVQLLQPSLILQAPRAREVVQGQEVELNCRAEVTAQTST